jgi:hypothetical protein
MSRSTPAKAANSAVCLFIVALSACASPPQTTAVVAAQPCLQVNIKKAPRSLVITNNGSEDWTDVRVLVNETDNSAFQVSIDRIKRGESHDLPLRMLVRDDGLKFDPQAYEIVRVALKAEQGSYSGFRCNPDELKRFMDLILQSPTTK